MIFETICIMALTLYLFLSYSVVSACLPSLCLRNLLTCPVATSSAEHVGKGMLHVGLDCGFTNDVPLCFLFSWWLCAMHLCVLRFLNLKIQEGEAHNIFCPAFDCYQLVPVEVIESVVSREMDRRYLQFDIKVKEMKNTDLHTINSFIITFYTEYKNDLVTLRTQDPWSSISM